MLAHVLAVLGLALYGFEVYRTVERFGVKRPGMLGVIARGPAVHMVMAILLTLIFVVLAVSFAAVPFYVAPVAGVINAVYLVLAVRYARRRSREGKARPGRGR